MRSLTAFLFLVLQAAATPAVAQSGAAPLRELDLREVKMPTEGGGEVIAERGVIHVPLKRDDPDSRMIQVEVYRFPAADGFRRTRHRCSS